MNHSLFLIGLLSLSSLSSLKAATVVFGTNPSSRTIANEAGINYSTSGGSFWIGTFSNESGFATTANNSLTVADNVAAIIAAGGWEQFTVDTASSAANAGAASTLDFTVLSSAARLGGSATDNNFGGTKADFFNGKQIYVWAFNAETIGAATEMGIFEATSATTPWLFPTNAGGLGDSVTLSTTVAAATIAAVNGVGSISGSQLRTEVYGVPEPSRLILLGLSSMGLIFRRRRA